MENAKMIEEKCENCLHYRACLLNSEYVPTLCRIHEDRTNYRKQSEGEWVRHKENCLYNKCSICSYEHCREDNYCPNCGAKMKGGAE